MSLAVLFLLAIAFGVLTLLGYFAAVLLLPSELPRSLVWSLAPGIGAGICSLIFFVFRRPMFSVELTSLVLLSSIWFLCRRMIPGESRERIFVSGSSILGLFLLGAVGLALYGLLVYADRMPHGDWDAWAIWNNHARFLYRDGPNWKELIPLTVHGDYPLLTPSLTARLWRYGGEEVPEAGVLLGIMFTLAGVATLVAAISLLRDRFLAIVMGLVLIGTPFYLERGAAQEADVPLSFFILSTVALLCIHYDRYPNRLSMVIVAGFTAGCAGWTKNEGLLLILATSIALLMPIFSNAATTLRRVVAFAVGLSWPLAVNLYFKLTIALPNDLISQLSYGETIPKILNLARHITILEGFGWGFWTFGAWIAHPMVLLAAFIALKGADRRILQSHGWRSSSVILGIVLMGYYGVYLITPWTLEDHLSSSLSRLLIHLWPSFLLLVSLIARGASLSRTDHSAVSSERVQDQMETKLFPGTTNA